ncbi:conjugal transfer protein TrbI [Serratia quinivorans]|uniref:VirB10/TraB/TrbI family type IV secretion system protein n=1 Tax=Serratia quinivorans TaxID=137545 RepID=UPI001C4973E9|nr:VirB10/TraB/TrbI family type IV secretion system protein [Serratia quinivorans]MBV6695259.1 conjugal transfer protein TrbI [Serratia quinivorans]
MSNENKTSDEIEQELQEREELLRNEKPHVQQREKTVAEIEEELRERQEREARENDVEEEVLTHQPEVIKLKKSKKDRVLKGMLYFTLALIIAAVVGLKIYQKYKTADNTDKQESVKSTEGSVNRRSDLGQGVDPFKQEEPPQSEAAVSTSGGEATTATPGAPSPMTFSRALAVVSDSTSASQSSGTSRQQETQQGDDKADAAPSKDGEAIAASEGDEGALQAVRRIPYNPDLYLPENTPLPCALTRRFISDVAGKLQCQLTEDVYSASKNTKLLDKGTVATLMYKTGTLRHGQARAFVIATKLRTQQPPFLDIPLVDTAAAGELGEAGMDGWVDTHFFDRFVGAMMLGIIPDIANAATDSAGKKDRNTDYTENSRQAFADMAKTAFENSVNIPPTIYKNQGEIITLVTGRDIDFSKIYRLQYKRG